MRLFLILSIIILNINTAFADSSEGFNNNFYGNNDIGIGDLKIGPKMKTYFETNSENSPFQLDSKDIIEKPVFIGFTAFYGSFKWQDFTNRVGIQYMTDLSTVGQQINRFSVQLEFNIPFMNKRSNKKSSASRKPAGCGSCP